MCSAFQFGTLENKSLFLKGWGEGLEKNIPRSGTQMFQQLKHHSKLAASMAPAKALVTGAPEEGVWAGYIGWLDDRQQDLGLQLPILGLASIIDRRGFIFPFPLCLFSF